MPPATAYTVENRTRLLVDPSRYLTTGETRTLTGHTAHRLARLVDEARLTARPIGRKSFAFQTSSVVSYCLQQNTQVSLFALLFSAGGDHLTEQELDAELNLARDGGWRTLARREHAPPDWPTWQSWYSGGFDRARALLSAERSRWEREIKEQRVRGLTRRTLWLPSVPLGMFGEYSLARYQQVTGAGGCVRVLPAHKIAHLESRAVLPDLEVVPGAVFVRRYTRVGSRAGAVRVTEPTLVQATVSFLDWADHQHTVPLRDFARLRRQGAA